MFVRGKLDAFPEDSLIITHSSGLAIEFFDNGILPIKQDGETKYYIKNKKTLSIMQKFAKKGGCII